MWPGEGGGGEQENLVIMKQEMNDDKQAGYPIHAINV